MNTDIKFNFGIEIDEAINLRESSKTNLMRANFKLIDLGAVNMIGDSIFANPRLNLKEYKKCNNQEFQWQAWYSDGFVINQYEEDEAETERTFADIDFTRLVRIHWSSNFETETDNDDKRVIISLDWTTGLFSFYNGITPQEVKETVLDASEFMKAEEKKLILKMVKRVSQTASLNPNAPVEVTLYNRYLLGYETAEKKVIICIEPNGYVHLWHNQ